MPLYLSACAKNSMTLRNNKLNLYWIHLKLSDALISNAVLLQRHHWKVQKVRWVKDLSSTFLLYPVVCSVSCLLTPQNHFRIWYGLTLKASPPEEMLWPSQQVASQSWGECPVLPQHHNVVLALGESREQQTKEEMRVMFWDLGFLRWISHPIQNFCNLKSITYWLHNFLFLCL